MVLLAASAYCYTLGKEDDTTHFSDNCVWQLGEKEPTGIRSPGIAQMFINALRQIGLIGEPVWTQEGAVLAYRTEHEYSGVQRSWIGIPVTFNGTWFNWLKSVSPEIPASMGLIPKEIRNQAKEVIAKLTDSKFIGGNARLPVKVNNYSHPITFSMNRAVCRDITSYGDVGEDLIHGTQVERPSEIILLADGCQNPRNLNQANATAYRIFSQVGESGPLGEYDDPIPVGPDVDTPNGDGWFRYPDGTCHAVFCDGSARAFRKGTILKRNIWIDVVRESAEGS